MEFKADKFTQLFDGDGLSITKESEFFNFKCCDCGLVHRVEIEHVEEPEKQIILYFHTEREK